MNTRFTSPKSHRRSIPNIICEPPTPWAHHSKFESHQVFHRQRLENPSYEASPANSLGSTMSQHGGSSLVEGHSIAPSSPASEVPSSPYTPSPSCSPASVTLTQDGDDAPPLSLTAAALSPLESPATNLGTSSASNMPVATSATNSARRKPRKRNRKPGHIPRPRNAFILFRSHAVAHGLVSQDLNGSHCKISRIISHMWKSLDEIERRAWDAEAEAEKAEHARKYPDYKFQPKTKRRVKGPRADVTQLERECQEVADSILKAHGRSGVLKSEDGQAPKSRTTQMREARNRAFVALQASRAAEKASRDAAKLSKQAHLGIPGPRTRKQTRKTNSPWDVDENSSLASSGRPAAAALAIPTFAAVTAGDLATSVPGEFYQTRRRSSAALARTGSSYHGSLPRSTSDLVSQQDASDSLFGNWHERLAQASQVTSESTPGSLRQTEARKERPQPFHLLSASSVDMGNNMPISPMSVPINADGTKADLFRRPNNALPPTPRFNSWTGFSSEAHVLSDKMLVSPLRSSFSTVRKFSTGWPGHTRVSFQKGLASTSSAGGFEQELRQSQPRDSLPSANMPNPLPTGDDNDLFEQAAIAAAASLASGSTLAGNDDSVFAFEPDFLRTAELSPNSAIFGDDFSSALSGTSSRPGTYNGDASSSVDRSVYSQSIDHGQQPTEAAASGVVAWEAPSVVEVDWADVQMDSVNTDLQRRRSTIDGLKHALSIAAAAMAARPEDGESASTDVNTVPSDSASRNYSLDVLDRWRQSISAGSKGQREASVKAEDHFLGTLPEDAAHTTQTDAFGLGSDITFADPGPSARHDVPVDLQQTLGFDFSSLPILWDMYGLDVDVPVDRDLLDLAFEELEGEDMLGSSSQTTSVNNASLS